ncbi:MAG TPA: grasp-with-spasm system ATP-grasp peptide maturase [Chitinophagaceae bacterium]|nr:grasp-with-spasm system ATP-grasp peptide maturase [Chitinophagaceae bacterium]
MVLIYSNNTDWSTNDVMLWMHYLGGNTQRIHINDTILNDRFNIQLSFSGRNQVYISGKSIKNLKSIWFRRTDEINYTKLKNEIYYNYVKDLISNELKYTRQAFYKLNKKSRWLTHPDIVQTDKIEALLNFKECGLEIPETIITNNKTDLLRFIKKYKRIIIKPIFNMEEIAIENKRFLQYTTEITYEIIEKLPDVFFPALFQKLIVKELEIRSFVLMDKVYSMAIFSQNNSSTTLDFRNKTTQNNVRTVPYKLPTEIEGKMCKYMKIMKMNNGSIDIIKTRNNKYIFLEINSVGQFGMVSFPCNYFLEREIAKTLLNEEENI